MNSTINPDAVLAARADERLAHAYEQIARADDELARVTEKLSRLQHDAARRPAVVAGPRPSRGRSALRGFVGLVLAGGIGVAAFAWQSSYGEPARSTIAQWAPNLLSTSPAWSTKPANPATSPSNVQPASPSAVQLAAVEPAPAQPTPSAPTLQDVASTPAPTPAELMQTLQAMSRDIATVEQGIEDLKASQAQIATDNAAAIAQLNASQEQMAHLVTKPAVTKPPAQNLRARPPAPPPRPVASATRKPPPAQPSVARAHPQPIQLQPKEQ